MRVNEDYETWNASCQLEDEHSVLTFYKRALETRKQYPVLVSRCTASIGDKR